MSYWVELHCDVLSDNVDPKDCSRSLCYSYRNDNVAAMARNPSHAAAVIVRLQARALHEGWVKHGRKWACPGCKTELTSQGKR